MTMTTLIKESIYFGHDYRFRGLFHGGEHGGTWVDMVLEELRILQLDP